MSSNPAGSTDVYVVSVVCCQVEVSVLGWSRVQRSPAECCVYECDCETLKLRRPRPARGWYAIKKNIYVGSYDSFII